MTELFRTLKMTLRVIFSILNNLSLRRNINLNIRKSTTGLEITAGQRTMSGLIWELTGQPFVLPVMLTGHI